MSDVQFEEEEMSNREATASSVTTQSSSSYMTGLILKTGIVKSEAMANLILLIIACAFCLGAIYLYSHAGVKVKVADTIKKLPPELMAKFPSLKKN